MELRETIRNTVSKHLDAGYMVAGQCLSAVGWVGNTLPERYDMTELSMADVAGGGFITGMALAGKKPIYVIRYQGFSFFNLPLILSYACKSKELWDRPCPLLIRCIAMEGGIGPVAGSSHHSLAYRMPGIKIYSPMTPGEYQTAYEEFIKGDDVVLLSEHRGAWANDKETQPISIRHPDIVLFPISITRFAAIEAAKELLPEGIRVCVHPISRVKPLYVSQWAKGDLASAKHGGIVLDDDYTNGIAKSIAFDLNVRTVMGLEDRSAGFYRDNLPPNKEEIKTCIRTICKGV